MWTSLYLAVHLLSLDQSTELSAWRLFFLVFFFFCTLLVGCYFLCLSSSFPPVAHLGRILVNAILSPLPFLPSSDGKFGAYMQVHIQNDGPVTIELESPAAAVDPKQVSKPERLSARNGCPGYAFTAEVYVCLYVTQICETTALSQGSIPVTKQYSFPWT